MGRRRVRGWGEGPPPIRLCRATKNRTKEALIGKTHHTRSRPSGSERSKSHPPGKHGWAHRIRRHLDETQEFPLRCSLGPAGLPLGAGGTDGPRGHHHRQQHVQHGGRRWPMYTAGGHHRGQHRFPLRLPARRMSRRQRGRHHRASEQRRLHAVLDRQLRRRPQRPTLHHQRHHHRGQRGHDRA